VVVGAKALHIMWVLLVLTSGIVETRTSAKGPERRLHFDAHDDFDRVGRIRRTFPVDTRLYDVMLSASRGVVRDVNSYTGRTWRCPRQDTASTGEWRIIYVRFSGSGLVRRHLAKSDSFKPLPE
jgi:hypothetical protein